MQDRPAWAKPFTHFTPAVVGCGWCMRNGKNLAKPVLGGMRGASWKAEICNGLAGPAKVRGARTLHGLVAALGTVREADQALPRSCNAIAVQTQGRESSSRMSSQATSLERRGFRRRLASQSVRLVVQGSSRIFGRHNSD